MICESEDRLTGRVIIVVARTTDYCFLCNRKSFGISYCIKSPPGRILSYFSAKTGSLTGSGCIFEYWCEFHLDEKETLL